MMNSFSKGYTSEEIAYMGTCLQRWAIKQGLGSRIISETGGDHVTHSFYDKNDALYVDCSECERGGKGAAKDKCSAGWKQKKPGLGCFCGTLIKGIIPGKWNQ